ncbi:hypothetical protein EDB86DRAFT_1208308 [Lactarius hatsudake]|nr:hypothetical protein EDB86DRAFT_1208308 [Lactarius hatsudake]
MSISCSGLINPNPDLAGIGTRINFYATILLISLIPENEITTELLDGLYENSVFYGLALVLTAVIQTLQHQLDLYHAIFVMQIIFSLDFVYAYGMRRFFQSSRNPLRATLVIAVQMFSTAVFTVWLLCVWAQNSHFGSQPGLQPPCQICLLFCQRPRDRSLVADTLHCRHRLCRMLALIQVLHDRLCQAGAF